MYNIELLNYIIICDQVNMSIALLPMSSEFHWNSTTVGLIQSSFFWGYLLTQVFPNVFPHPISFLFLSFGARLLKSYANELSCYYWDLKWMLLKKCQMSILKWACYSWWVDEIFFYSKSCYLRTILLSMF